MTPLLQVKNVTKKYGGLIANNDISFDVAENDQNTKKGNTRLEMAFNTKLPHVVTVIVYAHFPAVMRIDKSRKIQL